MSDVSSVINYFPTVNEGFSTTLGTTISSGATSIPLNGTAGLTDGSIFVGIIEPGATNQQVFTGTVDVAGSQITGVVWTRGSNVPHVAGVTIVDYTTGTGSNMLTTGILKQHTQTGAHHAITNTGGLTTDTLDVTGDSVLGGDITISGDLSVSGVLTLPNNSVVKSDLELPHYNALFFATNSGIVFGNVQTTCNYNASDTTNGYGITADTSAHTLTTTRAGLYMITANFRCIDVTATDFITFFYIIIGANTYDIRRQDQSIGTGQQDQWSVMLYLPSGAEIYQQVYNGTGNTRFGRSNDGGTADQIDRIMAMSLTVAEVR